VAEREVYAALDWLVGEQARIEAALARKHLADGTLVLFMPEACLRHDVSSSYMEGRCCALARHGYSRDRRPEIPAVRPQIVYGLLCAPRSTSLGGTPVAVEVFEGNSRETATDAGWMT
jgi:hypothetical protein